MDTGGVSGTSSTGAAAADSAEARASEERLQEEFAKFFAESEMLDMVSEDEED